MRYLWPLLYFISVLICGASSLYCTVSEERVDFVLLVGGLLTVCFWIICIATAKTMWGKFIYELSLIGMLFIHPIILAQGKMIAARAYLEKNEQLFTEVRLIMQKSDYHWSIHDLLKDEFAGLSESERKRLRYILDHSDIQSAYCNKHSFQIWIKSELYFYYNEEPPWPYENLRKVSGNWWIY